LQETNQATCKDDTMAPMEYWGVQSLAPILTAFFECLAIGQAWVVEFAIYL
jgi:hypothetical protein